MLHHQISLTVIEKQKENQDEIKNGKMMNIFCMKYVVSLEFVQKVKVIFI